MQHSNLVRYKAETQVNPDPDSANKCRRLLKASARGEDLQHELAILIQSEVRRAFAAPPEKQDPLSVLSAVLAALETGLTPDEKRLLAAYIADSIQSLSKSPVGEKTLLLRRWQLGYASST